MKFLNQQYSTRRFMDEEGGAEGGDGGGSGGLTQADIDSAVESAISGLKEKNNALLGEVKTFKETAKQWEGFDKDEVSKIMDLFKNNEEAQLIKDGKFDEVITKRMDKVNTEHETKLKTMKETLDALSGERDLFKSKFENKFVDDAIQKAALGAKVRPEALADVTTRARQIFKVDENGELEARDKDGNLMKTELGDLLTPERFVDSLKKVAPHYWPESESANLGGGASDDKEDLAKKLQSAADAGDMVLYQKIRAKMK